MLMGNEITVDLSRFKLDARKNNIKQNIDKAVKTGALYLEKPLKQECPVDTSTMMRSIGSRQDGEAEWLCVARVEYAPYVIYGTSRQDANNFPARVVKSEKDKVTSLIKETIMK